MLSPQQSVAADTELIASGRLQPGCATALYTPNENTPWRGVVLALHGFTAGPWQYQEVAEALVEQGYCVFVPRLLGHGAISQPNLPKAQESAAYHTQAMELYAQAKMLCQHQGAHLPLTVMGFSLGGALALDIAHKYAKEMVGLILLAPLLQPFGWRNRLLLSSVRMLVPWGLHRRLDGTLTEWGPVAPKNRPGYWHFSAGTLYCALHYAHLVGRRVFRRGIDRRLPLQLVVSSCDQSVDNRRAMRLLQKGQIVSQLLRFPRACKVPHALLSPLENPRIASRQLIIGEIKHFLSTCIHLTTLRLGS